MSNPHDITKNLQQATRGAECRTKSENQPAHGRAHDYDTIDPIDVIHHHNERGGKKERGPASKAEPEPDYEVEGMRPHN